MSKQITQEELESYLWGSAVLLRNHIDAGSYKQYIFPLLFFKRLNDVYEEETAKAIRENGPEADSWEETHSFVLPKDAHWNSVRNVTQDVGKAIQVAFRAIEKANPDKLHGIFGDGTWTNKRRLPDRLLKDLLEHFSSKTLSLANCPEDELGRGYEYLIKKFADDSGHTAQEFYTNRTVVHLMAELLEPQPGESIYDPTCGSGGLLLKAYKKVPSGKVAVYGQELNAQTWALCTMNMFLHGVDDARIWQGDTLSNPQNLEDDKLMKFQVVVANPPFSLDKWDSGFLSKAGPDEKGKKPEKMTASLDEHHRFDWGVPPSSKGDYAFVLHMLHSLDAENGRMAVVLPHGVLFRGASEGKIRRQLIEMNLLDAVIGLPANLFYGTGIPACILVFKKGRTRDDVLFIDASGEGNYEKGKNQNLLRDSDIARIVSTYEAREAKVDKYSYRASRAEIRENDYNLNIPRYVDTFEEEELVDIDEVKRNIASIEAELSQVQAQMAKYMEELGL